MAQIQTIVEKTIETAKTSRAELLKIVGRLGNPAAGRKVGERLQATLTGKIEIRSFNGQKGAYFTTEEGYSCKVNDSYNPSIHKAGANVTLEIREIEVERDGKPVNIRYAAMV